MKWQVNVYRQGDRWRYVVSKVDEVYTVTGRHLFDVPVQVKSGTAPTAEEARLAAEEFCGWE